MRGFQAGRARSRAAWFVITLLLAGVAGCSRSAPPASAIKLMNAYVMQPGGSGSVAAYLVIQNLGSADELLSARSSAGGTVELLTPISPGSTAIRTANSVAVPAHATMRMNPAGLRLLITSSGPLSTGKDISLTLIFAHAGAITVEAQVTNAQPGGSSYFGP